MVAATPVNYWWLLDKPVSIWRLLDTKVDVDVVLVVDTGAPDLGRVHKSADGGGRAKVPVTIWRPVA